MTTAFSRSGHDAEISLAGTTVRDAMHRGVVSCPPDASLRTLAAIMAAHRIHAVAVKVDERGRTRRSTEQHS